MPTDDPDTMPDVDELEREEARDDRLRDLASRGLIDVEGVEADLEQAEQAAVQDPDRY